MQFLARALPILKEEYETIPKVARYVHHNANSLQKQNHEFQQQHLLNPTHSSSALNDEQMDQINRLFMEASGHQMGSFLESRNGLASSAENYLPSPPFRRRRRRKRSLDDSEQSRSKLIVPGSGRPEVLQVPFDASQTLLSAAQASPATPIPTLATSGLTIGELGSNVSLVVSSAHSAPARSLGMLRLVTSGDESVDHHKLSQMGLMTRDGFKPNSAITVHHQRAIGQQQQSTSAINKRNLTLTNQSQVDRFNVIPNQPFKSNNSSLMREQTVYTSNIQMAGNSRQQQEANTSSNQESPTISQRHSDQLISVQADELRSKNNDHYAITTSPQRNQHQQQVPKQLQNAAPFKEVFKSTLEAQTAHNESASGIKTQTARQTSQNAPTSSDRQKKTTSQSSTAPCSDQSGFTAA